MLPGILSEVLCSLNADCDRLAFSVFVTLNQSGEIVPSPSSPRFCKTVIRSCAKLDYDVAQRMIEHDGKLDQLVVAPFHRPSGGYTVRQVAEDVIQLNKVRVGARDTVQDVV
jgi:exoribonuclease II